MPATAGARYNGHDHGHELNGNVYDDNDDSGYLALDQLLASLALENDIMERQLSQINNNDTATMKFKSGNVYQTNGTGPYDTMTSAATPTTVTSTLTASDLSGCVRHSTSVDNLNDVLANLLEFSENEQQLPQTNHHCYANGTLTNGTHSYQHQHHPTNHLTPDTNQKFTFSCHMNGPDTANTAHINNNNNHYHTATGLNGHAYIAGPRHFTYHEPNNMTIKRLTSESENSSSISPSLSERSNGMVSWSDQVTSFHSPHTQKKTREKSTYLLFVPGARADCGHRAIGLCVWMFVFSPSRVEWLPVDLAILDVD